MPSKPTIGELAKIKRLSWVGVFFFGLGLCIVPDWGDRETISGAVSGFMAFIAIATYSYRVQWRKRSTKKQLNQGWRQHYIVSSILFLPLVSIGLFGATLFDGSNFEPYAKGAVFVFIFLSSIFAIINIYTHKGFFQKPLR